MMFIWFVVHTAMAICYWTSVIMVVFDVYHCIGAKDVHGLTAVATETDVFDMEYRFSVGAKRNG